MLDRFLCDFIESCILGQVGNISVHLAVHLDVLYDLVPVGL